MEHEEQVREVMKYFRCDKEMAERIIKASVMNGDAERIKYLCKNDWSDK